MITFDDIGFDGLNELVNFLKHSYFAHKSRAATLEDELDQLRQTVRKLQQTQARLNSEIGDLRAENDRLLEVIRLQAATHLEAPEIDPVALAVAAGQAGFDWQADE